MSYSEIFKDKDWTVHAELNELAEVQHPLASMDYLEELGIHLMVSIADMKDKSLQAEMISILPDLYKLLTTCQKIFLASYVKES